ncbi:M-phase inducer phosphatase-like [Ylistrum balloti]|uniref:M-phase inducer phosphatase-like n=1 Tax=Ylistrum balloti TaxID=509963 RepID=UPI002905AD86|nr:M-phase inducer phosphatase-like [Ylistrum balloti]
MTFDQDMTSDPDVTFIQEMMTPEKKRNTTCFHDDDSGLGFDDEDYMAVFGEEFSPRKEKQEITDSNNEFQFHRPSKGFNVRRDMFSMKRLIQDDGDDDPAPNCRILTQKSVSFAIGDRDNTCFSADIKMAVDLMAETEDLVADGSRQYCLPTVKGKHQDLKSISPQTMRDVLRGDYDEVIASCRIIDCRYPYEFEGGHIQGAENLHTHETIKELLQTGSRDNHRHILIFHCEFSSERGPKMYRFLRAQDRAMNKESYPSLNYPEVYLLDGGYKAFYEHDKVYCRPSSYVPMLHKSHGDDLRHFRSRSKSWAAGEKRKNATRLQF